MTGPFISAQIGRPVTIRLHSGRVLHGVLDAAGEGQLVLRSSSGVTIPLAQTDVAELHTRERRS